MIATTTAIRDAAFVRMPVSTAATGGGIAAKVLTEGSSTTSADMAPPFRHGTVRAEDGA